MEILELKTQYLKLKFTGWNYRKIGNNERIGKHEDRSTNIIQLEI